MVRHFSPCMIFFLLKQENTTDQYLKWIIIHHRVQLPLHRRVREETAQGCVTTALPVILWDPKWSQLHQEPPSHTAAGCHQFQARSSGLQPLLSIPSVFLLQCSPSSVPFTAGRDRQLYNSNCSPLFVQRGYKPLLLRMVKLFPCKAILEYSYFLWPVTAVEELRNQSDLRGMILPQLEGTKAAPAPALAKFEAQLLTALSQSSLGHPTLLSSAVAQLRSEP